MYHGRHLIAYNFIVGSAEYKVCINGIKQKRKYNVMCFKLTLTFLKHLSPNIKRVTLVYAIF